MASSRVCRNDALIWANRQASRRVGPEYVCGLDKSGRPAPSPGSTTPVKLHSCAALPPSELGEVIEELVDQPGDDVGFPQELQVCPAVLDSGPQVAVGAGDLVGVCLTESEVGVRLE